MALHKGLTADERAALSLKETSKLGTFPEAEAICPAAHPTRTACFLCRVDQSIVEARLSPNTYYGRCSSPEYHGCPTWRAEKEREASLKKLQKSQGR